MADSTKAAKAKLLRKAVRDIKIQKGMRVSRLIESMAEMGGFSGQHLCTGIGITREMLADKSSFNFLSFPADIVSTGTRGVLATLVREGYVDAIITTCGTLDHDLARSFRSYYHGDWDLDDAALHRRHVYRLGNIVIPEANYGTILERKMRPILDRLWAGGTRALSTRALSAAIGEAIPARERLSILRAAFDRHVPVIVPGITDGAVGSQVWLYWQDHRGLSFDLLSDEQLLSDLVYEAKRAGAVMLGGGISKHHTIWWNQFRGGLDAALYLTTAVEWDGSLSGARTREAVSWGKVKATARHTTVTGDVTVLFPLMVGAALERIR